MSDPFGAGGFDAGGGFADDRRLEDSDSEELPGTQEAARGDGEGRSATKRPRCALRISCFLFAPTALFMELLRLFSRPSRPHFSLRDSSAPRAL